MVPGVESFLRSHPSFEQLFTAVVVNRDFFPVNVYNYEYVKRMRSARDTELLETLNTGLRLEALSFCGHSEWIPTLTDRTMTWDLFTQSNAVRALARLRRTEEAAAILRNMRGVLDDTSFRCLASDILFACGHFKAAVQELAPDMQRLPSRYLRLLGRSYSVDPKTYKLAIDVLELMPDYDYYRWHHVPRLKVGKPINAISWDFQFRKRLVPAFKFRDAVKPLDDAFASYFRDFAPKST